MATFRRRYLKPLSRLPIGPILFAIALWKLGIPLIGALVSDSVHTVPEIHVR